MTIEPTQPFEEEEFPAEIPEDYEPDWNWRIPKRERPNNLMHSTAFDGVRASIRRWCPDPRFEPDPEDWGRVPPPKNWRTPRRMGGLEVLVVLALLRLDEGGCARDVVELIAERTGRVISMQVITKSIFRLKARRYVRPAHSPWRWRDCRVSRYFYRVEPLGRRAARLTLLAGDRMRDGLPGIQPGARPNVRPVRLGRSARGTVIAAAERAG